MIHPKHIEWLEARGIRSDTAEALEVCTVQDGRGNWLQFPYRLNGEVVNRKRRMTAEKRHEMDRGAKLCLWNAAVLRSPQVVEDGASVIITEGEFDAMVAIQCGFPTTTSVPNGAPEMAIDDPVNSNRYRFLWESQSDLEKVKTFILATDADTPGITLAHDMASILGPERCRFLTYPEGCKDLNEVLLNHGPATVAKVINEAKPYPVQGLYRMSQFPEAPPIRGMATGIDALDPHMQIVLGTLTVVTGYSNMGKTTVLDTMLAHCVSHHVPVCVASFETQPKPILFDGIARAIIGCGQQEFERHPRRDEAYALVEENVGVISNALDDELEFDIDTFLETARVSVLRDGARVVLLDPWNELEHKRAPGETLTEYVGRAIRKIKQFIRKHNVAFFIVAHPTKPMKGATGMPSLYDISDSAHWANKADYGLIYHRPDKAVNMAQLAVVKVRKGLPGEQGMIDVKFDHRVGRINGYLE